MRKIAGILLLCIIFSFSFKDEPACATASLRQKAPFPVGTAINTEKLKYEERYWETALAEFNSFTPEKVMKPAFIHPEKDRFDFSETDQLVKFCFENKIRLHGHTLLWHKAEPRWLDDFEGSAEDWEQLMKTHIQTIVSRYKGQVKSWDVVNEAFNDDGSLRKTLWLKNIGPSYIEKAFLFAAEADPGALLFYNDYSLEHLSAKLDAVLEYLNGMRAAGVAVHGVGMQMHVGLYFPQVETINKSAARIAAEGFVVHYSELDVNLEEAPLFSSRKKINILQKDRVKAIVSGFMQLNARQRFGITLWGVSDNDSWLMEESVRSRPLLFDKRYRQKPAYCGFLEAL